MAEYDAIRDQHFPGIGNNTVLLSKDRDYHRYRNREANAGAKLFRKFGSHHTLSFSGFYQMVKVLENADRFISINHAPTDNTTFNTDNFAGAKADYDFNTVNHKLFPSKGYTFQQVLNLSRI